MVKPAWHDVIRDRSFLPEVVRTLSVLFLTMTATCVSAQDHDVVSAGDTLLFPNEVFVITAEELAGYNVNTLEDILEILPGVVHWITGPRGAHSGFSVDGRSHRGMTLLVNGKPFYDPYTLEHIARFLPLSRLERVEVIYSGSPLFTRDVSSNGAINIVIREGGGEGPLAKANFTYGRNNRRARRIWFSTPSSRIGATLAYDEYLQDAFIAYAPILNRRIGDYDTRSVLMDLSVNTDAGDDVLVRLHRFEDTYVGTAYSPREDVRYDGFDTEIRYQRGGFSASIEQRNLSLYRRSIRRSHLLTVGAARWDGMVRGVWIRAFASARHVICKITERGIAFDPSFHRVEGGIGAAGDVHGALSWRFGLFGGAHNVVGSYIGGEAGIRRGDNRAFSQSLMVSRRIRIPSAQELFQPEIPGDTTQTIQTPSTSGNEALSSEVTDELAFGASSPGLLTLDLFARRERSRIVLTGSDTAVYRADGTGTVAGVRGRIVRRGSVFGFRYDVSAGAEYFVKRSEHTNGIPEYRCLGGIVLSRSVFKETETVTFRWGMEFIGERSWDDTTLGSYVLNDVATSMTVLGATITVQMKNLFDVSYETYPGYLMPERHWIMGVFWTFRD
jgi:hypothetical protein